MKHSYILTLAFLGLGMGISQSANAQNWQGHAPADVIVTSSTTKADDDHTLYLYNPKTGLFLNLGGYWGTQPGLHEVGIPLKLVATDGDRYKICTGIVSASNFSKKDWCVGYVRDIDTTNPSEINSGNFYVDRLGFSGSATDDNGNSSSADYDGLVKATLTAVEGKTNTYTISFYDYGFNHVTEDGADQTVSYTYTSKQHYHVSGNTYSSQQGTSTFPSNTLLSEDELKSHVCDESFKVGKKTYTCTATPGYTLTTKVSSTIGKTLYFAANATTKGVEGKTEAPTDGSADWVIVTLADLKAEFKDKPASDAKPADATFLVDAQNFNRNNSRISTSWNSTAGSLAGWNSNPASAQYFYVGNGVTGDEHNDLYGQYWTANIINGGNGKVSQNVQIYREGWYRVRCKGFVSMASGSHVTAKLYANCSSNNAYNKKVSADLNVLTADLPAIDEEEDYTSKFFDNATKYTQAGKAFKANLYNNDLLIYVEGATVDALKTLTIGVDVADSESGDWICFDDVQLQYCGKGDLVLDENQTNADYMTKQVDADHSYTLILKRTTTAGIWNSLVLPVELTAQQFKTAFGDDAKLSVLQGVVNQGTRIQFKSVDLTKDTTKVVKPGYLYIMKPSKNANVQEGEYKKLIGGTEIKVEAPYYTINNITLKSEITKTKFEYTPEDHQTAEDGSITFWGTYLNSDTEKIVPAGSFGLGANDGKWYHSEHALPIKGFRCWIETQKNAGAKVSFSIDDEDMGVVTAIEGIETAPILRTQDAVYTLSGQKVRSSQSLEGLPKGIYIINNKKVIVK